MRKFMLAASALTLAMTGPALAGQDKGQGKSGGGQQAKADRGGNGGQMKQQGRGNDRQVARGNDRQDMRGNARQEARRDVRVERGNDRQDIRREARANDRDNRGNDRRDVRIVNRADDRDDNIRIVRRNFNDGIFAGRGGGLINGCPPGLDRKDNGCLPPGQARNLLGARLQTNFADSLVPYQYRSWYRDTPESYYRTGDGYIYQVNRNNSLVNGLIPLFGGGGYYALGDAWPQQYDFYNVPQQYRNYYADTSDYRYRYGDGAIYRLNAGSGVVDGIVALLAGDLGVGSRLPMGYDSYNVPFAYRDRYYDSADNWYRYNDGYIYQVDPKTRLISAVIDAIV